MRPRTAVFEAKRFLIHGLATALYGEDRSKLHPRVQEVLGRMELLIHHFIQEYKDARRFDNLSQSRDSVTEDSEGNKIPVDKAWNQLGSEDFNDTLERFSDDEYNVGGVIGNLAGSKSVHLLVLDF